MNKPGNGRRFDELSADEKSNYRVVLQKMVTLAREHAVPIIFAPPPSIGGEVNGATGVVGSRRNEVHGALDGATLPLAVDISADSKMLKIVVAPNSTLSDAVVWMVTYLDRADVAIDKGENAGKSMVYTQVVTSRQILGMWEAKTGASLKLPLPEVLGEASTGIAVIVQQEKNGLPGPILGAATFER